MVSTIGRPTTTLTSAPSVSADDGAAVAAAELLGACRVPELWRWPIPQSLAGLKQLSGRGIPLGVVSNASGQIAGVLARAGICQIGDGDGVRVRCVVDSHVVGVAKPDPAIFEHAVELFDGLTGRGSCTSATR